MAHIINNMLMLYLEDKHYYLHNKQDLKSTEPLKTKVTYIMQKTEDSLWEGGAGEGKHTLAI